MKRLSMRMSQAFTVDEGVKQFLRKCTVRNLSTETISLYSVHLQVFSNFLESKDCNVTTEISLIRIEDFILYLKGERQCKDVSINSYLRSLRSFLYFGMDENFVPPFKIRLLKVEKEIKETYSDTELLKLLKKPNVKTCDFTEYKIWTLSNYLLGTGNRISSVLNIKIADLDFDSGVIQINKTKNRKAQIIPLSAAFDTIPYGRKKRRKKLAAAAIHGNSHVWEPTQNSLKSITVPRCFCLVNFPAPKPENEPLITAAANFRTSLCDSSKPQLPGLLLSVFRESCIPLRGLVFSL